jgi:hypothetical protein
MASELLLMTPLRWSLLLVLAGCSSKPSGPREPETYTYSLSMGPRYNANPNIKIQINGKDAGTNSRFEVPRGVKLGDPATKLEAVYATTCGPMAFRLGPGSLNPDEAAERKKAPTATIDWSVEAPDTMPDVTEVYVDNQWGKPATIQIGTDSFSVGDMASKTVKVAFGPCASGRTVKIDDKIVGDVPPLEARWAALISTTKDMCYVQGTYGSSVSDEELSVFKQLGYVGKVPVTAYPLVEPPKGQVTQGATALISMPCELWAKAKKPATKRR